MKKIKTRKGLQQWVDRNREAKPKGQIGSSGVGSPTGTLALSGSIKVGSLIKQREP
jgi:hypothetical protein